MAKLLSEQRIKRFMTLAGNDRHARGFLREMEEAEEKKEELEEMVDEEAELEEDLDFFLEEEEGADEGQKFMEEEPMEGQKFMEEEPMEEYGLEEVDDEEGDEDADPSMEEDGGEEVDVTVDEEELASLRTAITVLEKIVNAGDQGAPMGDDTMAGDDMPPMGDDAMAGDDMPPMGDDAMADADVPPPEEDEEEEDPGAQAVAESKYINEITQKVLKRVTKRLLNK
jgi:hypothetical protein